MFTLKHLQKCFKAFSRDCRHGLMMKIGQGATY